MAKKKKKKSGLAGPEIQATVKKAGTSVAMFGAATGGVILGSLLMKQIPNIAQLPDLANKVIPGLGSMGVAGVVGAKVDNNYVKMAALGLGIAGFIDLANKTISQYLPSQFKLPTLNGLGNAINYGDYPPSYFTRKVNGVDTLELGEPNRMNLGANPLAIG
jgi:hypothetical protein